MVTDKLKKARVELTLAQAEVLLLAQDAAPAAKDAATRIMQRIGNAQLEIDTAETAANATAGMAQRLGQEVAKLLTAPPAAVGEQATPAGTPDRPKTVGEIPFRQLYDLFTQPRDFAPWRFVSPPPANGQPLPGTHV